MSTVAVVTVFFLLRFDFPAFFPFALLVLMCRGEMDSEDAAFDSSIALIVDSVIARPNFGEFGDEGDGEDLAGAEETFVEVFVCLGFLDEFLFLEESDFPVRFVRSDFMDAGEDSGEGSEGEGKCPDSGDSKEGEGGAGEVLSTKSGRFFPEFPSSLVTFRFELLLETDFLESLFLEVCLDVGCICGFVFILFSDLGTDFLAPFDTELDFDFEVVLFVVCGVDSLVVVVGAISGCCGVGDLVSVDIVFVSISGFASGTILIFISVGEVISV